MLAFLFRKVKPRWLAMGVPLVAILGFTAGHVLLPQHQGQAPRVARRGHRAGGGARAHAGARLVPRGVATVETEMFPKQAEIAQADRAHEGELQPGRQRRPEKGS